MSSSTSMPRLRALALTFSTALLVACAGLAPDRESTGLRADSGHAALELGRGAYQAGRYGLAIEHLERELARYPGSVAALNGLGACYDALGRHDAARRFFMQALALAPESPVTLGNLGASYLREGRPAEARAVLALAAKAAPADPWIAAQLARATAATDAAAVAVADAAPTAATPAAATAARVEVANGVGIEGLARAVRGWLAERGWKVSRVTNAPGFDQQQTEIHHLPGREAEAQALAAQLPLTCRVVADRRADDGTELKLTLGHDLAPQVGVGMRGAVLGWLAPSGAIGAAARVEVSNGNGVRGMARRVGASLRADGANVVRLTNAAAFDVAETEVRHRPGAEDAARELAAWLPLLSVRLVATDALAPQVDARIVLGKDLVPEGDPGAALATLR